MKLEAKEFTSFSEEKITETPAAPKVSKKRVIKTTLSNQYIRSMILNTDVQVKMQSLTKTTLD